MPSCIMQLLSQSTDSQSHFCFLFAGTCNRCNGSSNCCNSSCPSKCIWHSRDGASLTGSQGQQCACVAASCKHASEHVRPHFTCCCWLLLQSNQLLSLSHLHCAMYNRRTLTCSHSYCVLLVPMVLLASSSWVSVMCMYAMRLQSLRPVLCTP